MQSEDRQYTFISLCDNLPNRTKRALMGPKLPSVYLPPPKVIQMQRSVQNNLGLKISGIYQIPYDVAKYRLGKLAEQLRDI